MSWPASLGIAILTAIVAAVAGGFVAAACVDWYHVSTREGQSAFFIVGIGLLSGIISFFVGLVLTRFVGGGGATGFFKGLGASAGGALALVGAAGLVAWLLADIPPTINGHDLNLVVEIRLPAAAPQPVAGGPALKYIEIISSHPFTHTYRARSSGTLQVAEARLVDGRWVVPGSVYIFTTRGERSFDVPTSEHEAVGFELEFPPHPTAKYEQWSEWLPRKLDGKPWPDTMMSYRFRIEEILPAPDPEVVAEAEYAALTPESPLDKWLKFLKEGIPEDRKQAILKVLQARPADLAQLLRSPKRDESTLAMNAVAKMTAIDPEVIQAMRDIAAGMEDQIRELKTLRYDEAGFAANYDSANDIRGRYLGWSPAWLNVHEAAGVDGRPPLEEILKLATVHKDMSQMEDLASYAGADLGKLTPAAK